MSDLGSLLQLCIQFMQIERTVYGFTFSFWQIFLFGILAPALIGFIIVVIRGD